MKECKIADLYPDIWDYEEESEEIEEELMDFVEKSETLYPNERLPVYTYNGLPAERVV